MRLWIDPWDPEYGSSVDLDPDLGPPPGLELDVEVTGDWEPIRPAATDEPSCCAFIDGVRRVEAQLYAEENGIGTPALAGSWAVGCALSGRPPRIMDVVVGRELVFGAGLTRAPVELTVGRDRLLYIPRSIDGETAADTLQALQNAMRDAEAELARRVVGLGEYDLVVSDGPLTYFESGPTVGMIKRQVRTYLDPGRAEVVGCLGVGERTPLFRLGEQTKERYSWYLRLTEGRAIDRVMSSIVRLEVGTRDGLDSAVRLADLTSLVLPRFAPSPRRDPRAPQNLYPIGALETTLRHRLGDQALVRRALEVRLQEEAGHAA